ncbi:MAG: PD40 domain-containing protein [Deltaproteobacteria bacterium]|nr:PD40 domain-containing protein [Deltaproteobacteria bacterium]
MRRAALAVAFSILLSASFATGAPPARAWQTISVPGVEVHFHDGLEPEAQRAARIAQRVLPLIEEILATRASETIHIVLADDTDEANGFARVLPYDRILLLAGVPNPRTELSFYGDALEILVIHELTHVVHLDAIHGLPEAVNTVLGKTLSLNQAAPPWFTEGLAVYLETEFTNSGRNRSPYVDMVLRARLLGDGWPSLAELSSSVRDFPGPVTAWILGGRFVEHIARERGDAAIGRFVEAFGTRPIPYGANLVARETLGHDFIELYRRFVEEELARAHALETRRQRAGLAIGRRAAFAAESTRAPAWMRDGRLVAIEEPRDGDRTITVIDDVDSPHRASRKRSTANSVVVMPNGTLLADEDTTVDRAYRFRRLELVDVEADTARPFDPELLRISGADVSSDGNRAVMVQERAGRTKLIEARLGPGATVRSVRDLYESPPSRHVSSPKYLPSGSVVAAETTGRGGRRLIVVDRQGRAIPLTDPPGRDDTDPAPTLDGRFVYFARDVDQVYDIHRLELSTGKLERVTRSITGAIEPAIDPSGRRLAFTHAASTGFEVRVLDVRPEALLPVETATSADPHDRPMEAPEPPLPVFSARPYSPWPTLLPRAWMPTHAYDGEGDTFGAYVDADDALGLFSYRLRLDFGTTSKKLGFAFAAESHDASIPIYVDASLVHGKLYSAYVAPSRALDRLESALSARVGFSVHFPERELDQSVSISYGVEQRRGTSAPLLDPAQDAPRTYGDVTMAPLVFGYSTSSARGTADSVGASRGFSFDVGGRLHLRELGSDFRALVLSSHVSAYAPIKPIRGASVAARLGCGVGFGDARGRFFYALGGLPIRDVLGDAIDGSRFGTDVIRGFEMAAFRGPSFLLMNLEARAPLLDLSFGVDTLPFFFDRIHGAVFADAGGAGPIETLDPTNLGVGAELRLDTIAGYGFRATIRLGYARGLGALGIDNFFLVLGPGL